MQQPVPAITSKISRCCSVIAARTAPSSARVMSATRSDAGRLPLALALIRSLSAGLAAMSPRSTASENIAWTGMR